MTAAPIRSSRPDAWNCPRPTRDPMGNKYGPLQPLTPEPRSLFRWFRKKVK